MSVELLAPAGDFQTALAAFEAGADAVYCGLADFSARAFATNFSFEELEQLNAYARKHAKKVYVTFNTLLDEDQFDGAIETLAKLEAVGCDGVIVQDLGVAKLIRDHFPALALHASTQLVAHNLEGVLALKDLGFVRVVLARELSIEEIASIAKRCGGMELEVFIHGALCYSLSGLCLFGAMEKGRSGNRGKCPYCCRQSIDGHYPFSMKDLRIGENVKKLVEAGVVSLKIEGRMKSPLYVASVTKYYREILGSETPRAGVPRGTGRVTTADLETVFSRRTTELYMNGKPSASVIDDSSLGHLGTEIGVVKRVTRDREGRFWLRFHTARGLEKHDGLQFEASDEDGKHLGMAVHEMRQAISRRPVFEVNAGVDVEVELTQEMAEALKPGMKIYCSMSNAVKRMFPTPSFRPSDYPGTYGLDVIVTIAKDKVTARCLGTPRGTESEVSVGGKFEPAKNPEKTREAAEKAFAKLGGTQYSLLTLSVEDPDKLFVPTSVLNDLRRDLVEKLDEKREQLLSEKIEEAKGECLEAPRAGAPRGTVKIRVDQSVPSGDFDEVIVAVNSSTSTLNFNSEVRLALPVYTNEPNFNKLRSLVKRLKREGFEKWECADLATLKMLKACGITDITADWTLYAFNQRALAELSAMGVKRFVASPENSRENLQYLAESGYDVEFLTQQSTPLFMSLTKPAGETGDLVVYQRDNLWVTTKAVPRTFNLPEGVSTRLDLSWDPPTPEATEGKSQ